MFIKKKKKPFISPPTNFEHRVHTGFDKREGKFIGLPLQWTGIVGTNQLLRGLNRPLPVVDPSAITETQIMDLKVGSAYILLFFPIVLYEFNNNFFRSCRPLFVEKQNSKMPNQMAYPKPRT